MSFLFVSRRRYEAELAAAKAETVRQRERAEQAEKAQERAEFNRKQIAELYNELDGEHDRAVRRNTSLCAQLDELKDAASIEAQARRSAERIAELLKAVDQAHADLAAERATNTDLTRRVNSLQKQVDDALGLNAPAIAEGAGWQARREQRMRFDKPTAEEATA